MYNTIVSTGNGADAELGYSFAFKSYRARAFAGGYYYGNDYAQPIRGALAGVQLPINKDVDLLFTDSYNNLNHNSVALTVRISFGANRQYSKDVHDRLLDRVERHNGIISSGAASIAQQTFSDTGQLSVFRSNVWFFEPNSAPVQPLMFSALTADDCTYEHPCNNFSQSTIDQINTISPYSSLYFAPGAYALSSQTPLNVSMGQSLYGRTTDYQQSAQGSNRPLFTGALQMQGDNYLDSLRVLNTDIVVFNDLYFGQGQAALFVPDINNRSLWLNNMELSADASRGTTTFAAYNSALIATNGVLTINNSTLNATNSATDMNNSVSVSLHALGTAQITANNSSITNVAAGRAAYGAIGFNTATLTLNNSTITALMQKNGEARGLEVRDYSHATATHSMIKATSSGLHAWGALSNQHASLSLEQGSVNAMMLGTGGEAQGLNIRGFSQMPLNNLAITATSSGTTSTGAYLTEDGKLEMSGGTINTQMTGAGVASGLGLNSRSDAKLANQVTITTDSTGSFAIGALVRDNSILTFNSGSIKANMTGQGEADGIWLYNNSNAKFNRTTVAAISSGSLAEGVVTQGTSTLTFNSGTISANSAQDASGRAIGTLTKDQSTLQINDTTLLINNLNPLANVGTGIIKNDTTSTVGLTNIILNVNGARAYLTRGTNASDIAFSGTNQCTLNGQDVSCN